MSAGEQLLWLPVVLLVLVLVLIGPWCLLGAAGIVIETLTSKRD